MHPSCIQARKWFITGNPRKTGFPLVQFGLVRCRLFEGRDKTERGFCLISNRMLVFLFFPFCQTSDPVLTYKLQISFPSDVVLFCLQ